MGRTIALLGLGLWGQCLAQLFQNSGHQVQGWTRRLGGDPGACLSGADLLVSAVSMAAVPSLAPQLSHVIPSGLPLVSCSKGIAVDTLLTPLGVWNQFCPQARGLVLSGPNLSAELRQGLPAATVLSSNHTALAMELQHVLSNQQLRIYCNDDPRGTELAGALKNTMVIAAGISDGLGLGSNAKASLLCRGLSEMGVVLNSLGCQSQTLYGLAGLGDLLATANSPLSRNYRFGLELGRGKTPAAAEACCEGTVEGIPTTRAVVELAKHHGFSVPIAQQVLQLIEQQTTPTESVASLMERNLRPEARLSIEVGFSRQ